MIRPNANPIERAFEAGTPIDAAATRAADDARAAHRDAGVPLVVWRDGRIVWLDPHTLEEVAEPDFVRERK